MAQPDLSLGAGPCIFWLNLSAGKTAPWVPLFQAACLSSPNAPLLHQMLGPVTLAGPRNVHLFNSDLNDWGLGTPLSLSLFLQLPAQNVGSLVSLGFLTLMSVILLKRKKKKS